MTGDIAGFKQFSVVRLLRAEFFFNQITGAQGRNKSLKYQHLSNSKHSCSGKHIGSNKSCHESTSNPESLDDSLTEYNSKNVKPQLTIIFHWVQITFSVLDFGGKGMISIPDDGPSILQGLHAGGMKHLYSTLLEMSGGEDLISLQKFTPIFLAWMGVDDALEVRVRAGMSDLFIVEHVQSVLCAHAHNCALGICCSLVS